MNNTLYPWQHDLWQQFSQQQQQQRLAHAILLSGNEGLGKSTFANAIVANVLCTNLTDDHLPCGQCHSCQLLSAGNHPDHSEILPEEAGKQIKIDQIRQLKDKQQLTPSVANWKTIIISPANSMNISANNSLLKLLEEPQHNTLLILITSQAEKLPITIRSRCQNYHLASPPTEQALAWMAAQGQNPSKQVEQSLLLANGAPIKALALLNDNITEQYKQIEQDFNTIIKGQANPIDISKSWQALDLTQLLHTMQHLVKKRLTTLLENQPLSQLQTIENQHYLKISDCIISTIKLTSLSNNINNSLLTEDFIISVMTITQQRIK